MSLAIIAASLVLVGVAEADELPEGGYLITTSTGEVGAFGVGAVAESPRGTNVVSIVAADDGRSIWLLQADGVVNYSGEDVTRYAIADGSYACCIYRDLKGKLWVSTIEHGAQNDSTQRVS